MYYWLDITIYIILILLVTYTTYQSKHNANKIVKYLDWLLKLTLMVMTSVTILMLFDKFYIFEKLLEYARIYYIDDSEIFRR
jgi:peptidoglycan biosynthesis protein MviN/MurJ (putative lipid II flippase)